MAEATNIAYVSLGAVLKHDDSFVELLARSAKAVSTTPVAPSR